MASKGKAVSSTSVRKLKMLSVADKMAVIQDHERGVCARRTHVYVCAHAMYVVPIYVMHYIDHFNCWW